MAAREVAKEAGYDAKVLAMALAAEKAQKTKLEQALSTVRGELIDARETIFGLKRELAAATAMAERMLTAGSAVRENAGALEKALEEWARVSQGGVKAEERALRGPAKLTLNTSRDAATSPAQAETPLVDADSPLSSQRAIPKLEAEEKKLKLWTSKKIHAAMMDFVTICEQQALEARAGPLVDSRAERCVMPAVHLYALMAFVTKRIAELRPIQHCIYAEIALQKICRLLCKYDDVADWAVAAD